MWTQALQKAVDWLSDLGQTPDARLDRQKRRFLESKAQIDRLRNEAAERGCPLRVGERVSVFDGEKPFDGQIEYIHGISSPTEIFEPVVGAQPGWTAGGHRFKSTTGELSKSWTFAIVSFDYTLEAGIWKARERGIEAALNLPQMP